MQTKTFHPLEIRWSAFFAESDIKTGSMTKFNATLWVAGFSPFSTAWVEERLRGATAGTSNVLRRCFNGSIADRG